MTQRIQNGIYGMRCKQKSTAWWFWESDCFPYEKGAHSEDKCLFTSTSWEHGYNAWRWGGPLIPRKKRATCWRLRSRKLKEAEASRTSSSKCVEWGLVCLLLDFLVHEKKNPIRYCNWVTCRLNLISVVQYMHDWVVVAASAWVCHRTT